MLLQPKIKRIDSVVLFAVGKSPRKIMKLIMACVGSAEMTS